MGTTQPWHSKLDGTNVHHNKTDCTKGNNIEPKNKKNGTGGHRLCKECGDKNKKRK